MNASPIQPARRIIDAHLHMVGNGSGSTGCWLRSSKWHWPLHAFMVKHIGLPLSALKGNLDELYVQQLLHWVRNSSLDAVVILAHEQVYHESGDLMPDRGTTYIPNDYVLSLAEKHPEFLPAVSIHPARKDAMEELNRCIARGAVMMKCLPNCQNIDGRNRRYLKFWERMAEAGLPLLAHTGGEHTVEVVNKELSDPRTLQLPLECGVNVIAAHCATKSGPFDPQYFHYFVEMTQKYSNLYGDSSALNVPIRGKFARRCATTHLANRMIHGSDFPVPVFGHWNWVSGFVDWQTFRKWERQPNPLERDYQLKKAIGFPVETFCQVEKLFPQGRSRSGTPSSSSSNQEATFRVG
ncbi:MAG: amidohydrolase family protein [Verrucomicrobiales bacterium]